MGFGSTALMASENFFTIDVFALLFSTFIFYSLKKRFNFWLTDLVKQKAVCFKRNNYVINFFNKVPFWGKEYVLHPFWLQNFVLPQKSLQITKETQMNLNWN